MSLYKLTKVKLKDGQTSRIQVGRSIEGDTVYSIIGFIQAGKEVAQLSDIKIDDMIALQGFRFNDYLKTSPITNIVSLTDDELIFETISSVYQLKVLEK